jgi:hypothetical protein
MEQHHPKQKNIGLLFSKKDKMGIIDNDLVDEAANKFSETYWKQTSDYIKTSTF